MDDNLTQIILAAFALATVIATGVISILSLRMSQKAVTTSLANSVTLASVEHKVDGITSERVKAADDLGLAKAEIARHEGGDVARKEGIETAKELLNSLPLKTVDVNIVASEATVPVEIKDKPK